MTLKSDLDALLGRAAAAGDVPGVSAAVTSRDDTLYEGAFGQRVLGQAGPMTVDTVGWFASCTKALTGAAAMQLVEQGRLDLDSPAQRWMPAIGQARVLEGYDEQGKPRLREPRRPITLRHLLTHTAGYGYDFWSPELVRYQEVTGTPGIISCTEAALASPLLFDPGERWFYGINIDWAGRIVETVSGQKLGEYMRQHLFEPMGMRDTAFRITPSMRERFAKIHQRGDDDGLTPLDLEIPQEPENEMGGGGLYSTVRDYLKFLRMILNDGKADGGQVLKPETVQLMARNAMGDLRVTMLKAAIPSLTNDAEFFPGLPKSWGLTFQINEEKAPTGRPAGGLMWAGLANAYYWIDRSNGVAGVYLTQILPFADKKSLPLYYAFETGVYDAMR